MIKNWIKTPSGSYRTRYKGYVVLATRGRNTFTAAGKYWHANIRPPLTSNAHAHVQIENYKTLNELKADCGAIVDALAQRL